MKKNAPYLLALLGLIWVFAILVFYYLWHKPLTPTLAFNLALLVWRLLVAAILIILAGGLGYRLVRFGQLDPLARLALQAGLGLGILALVVLVVGVTAGIPRWFFFAAIPVLAFLLHRSIAGWAHQWSGLGDLWKSSDYLSRVVAVLLGVGLSAALAVALAPPIKYDALVYHLTMPEAYLRLGRVAWLPWLHTSGHPQTTEMLYTWAIALGGRQAAGVLSWCFAFLACLGLLGYLRQRLDVRPAWVATAALLAGSTLASSPAWAYADWLGLYFGLGCLVALDLWREDGARTNAILAGAFAGLAFSTKYTAGVLALVGVAALAWHTWKRRSAFLPALLQFSLAAAVFALPWLIKNWITTSNPLYPLFFPAGTMDAARIAIFTDTPVYRNWLDLFLLPICATITAVEGDVGYSVSVGPLLLGLGALAWIGRKQLDEGRRSSLQNAAVIALSGLLVWAVASRFSGLLTQTRLYFSLFPAFAVLAGYGFHVVSGLSLPKVRAERILAALVVLVISLDTLEVSLAALKSNAPQAALGLQSEADYLAQNLGWFQPAMQAVTDLPDGSRVQLIYETRSLYCQPVCQPDDILDRWQRDYTTPGEFQLIRERWWQQGITHILVYRSGVEFLMENDDPHHPRPILIALNDFLAQLPAPQDFGGVYELYPLTTRR